LRADAASRRELASDGRARAWLASWTVRSCRKARERSAALSHGLRTLALSRFPADVETLAREVEKRFAFMIRRDAAYLNWRFVGSPSKLHRAFGVYDRVEVLVGYAVVQRPRPGETIGYLVDVVARDERALAAAIEAGLAELESAGAGLVRATAIDGSWWNRVLVDKGFRAPKPDNHLIVILHPHQVEHPLVKAARDVRGWYFTDGDRDDETMG
jgi:hypothetical protein